MVILPTVLFISAVCALPAIREYDDAGSEKTEEEDVGVVNACDATNSKNWFIYCSGKLLDAAMSHRLYADSKTFVDKPLKKAPNATIAEFNKRFPMDVKEIETQKLREFVDEHFYEQGTELQKCDLSDWTEAPENLMSIADKSLQKWALDLHTIWKLLCRQMKPDVKENPEMHSLLYVPNHFVVPGGRFREFYYWDAYWIVKGLLASGMHHTIKLMLGNFAHIVEEHGFVPNGGRVYYLQRSQPPLLAPMVYEYFEATGDVEFVTSILPTLEKELRFWDTHRRANVTLHDRTFEMYQYRAGSTVPRPESYREDVAMTRQLTKTAAKRQMYRDIASAAESGWDFSSRWFADHRDMRTIETTNVLPVDLNAYICGNLDIISYLHDVIGNYEQSALYRQRFLNFRQTFQRVFYVREQSGWYDYNLRAETHNLEFYPSIAIPLFTKCYHSMNRAHSNRLYNQMEKMGVFDFSGGIPTSLANDSHQQWDFPNGWGPLNHMIIEGLRKSENPRMQRKAFELAQKWVQSNYKVFAASGSMWEKYNVNGNEAKGHGGEYEVQEGFGWTNGAIMDMLVTYSDRLKAPRAA